jgi:hypothetical protein
MKTAIKLLFATVSIALITACGGGSGGGSETVAPVASTLTFDVNAALRAITASGQNSNLSISSSNGCTGTGTSTASGATTSTTFEGRSALSATSTLNINYSNCSPATISNTLTSYVDTNYVPLGALGDKYLVYTGAFNAPTTARVADVGIISNFSRYTNSSKTTQDGTGQLSYVVEADSANSALITVVTKSYTMANSLELTQLTKYRINSSNQFTLVSITIQYANGVNIIMTRT